MSKTNSLGQKIKFFRQRAEMSQLELEIEMGAAAGMISRIEKSKVNPSKETVMEIVKVLDLNAREIDYLIGVTSSPATEQEMEKARSEVREIFQKRGKLAYLLDDRWRFILISESFKRLLSLKPEGLEYAIGKTTAQVITELDSPVMEWVDKKHREELIREYLPVFYSRMSYLHGDEIYENAVKAIKSNPFSKKIWEELEERNFKELDFEEKRVIYFDVWGRKFPLYYAGTALASNDRFELVEFYTENKVLDLLSKFI